MVVSNVLGSSTKRNRPLLDDLAVLEVDLDDVPTDARADIHGLVGFQPAVELCVVGQLASFGMLHAYLGRFDDAGRRRVTPRADEKNKGQTAQ